MGLTKEMQHLYSENYKTLMRVHELGDFDIVKMMLIL